jgi:hypothetical protein
MHRKPYMADGSGRKSDPPMGIGCGLKSFGEMPQSEAVRNIRAALFLIGTIWRDYILRDNFALAIFLPHPILFLGGRKAPKRNMLAAATAGLAKNQIA